MHQFAREKDDLVLLRDNRLVTALTDVRSFFQPRIVNPQFPTFELPRLAVKEVDEGQVSRGDTIAAVIAVEVEEIPFVAGGYLGFHTADGKFLHAKLFQNLRQYRLDACQNQILMMRQVHQDERPPMFIVDNAAIRGRRDHFTGAEVRLVFQRVTRQLLQSLRSEEFIKNYTLRRQHERLLGPGQLGLRKDRSADAVWRRGL